MDAALKGLPVMIINVDRKSLGQAKDCIDHGDFSVANNASDNNASELTEKLSSYLKDNNYRNQVDAHIKMCVHQYCEAFINGAVHNIINFINSDVELRGQDLGSKLVKNHVSKIRLFQNFNTYKQY